ncbi:MAG: MBL fold metallo-hydrolase [Nitrososphaerota archaeon]
MLRLDFRRGVNISSSSARLSFDSEAGPSEICCISHAHSDHVVEHYKSVMSPETMALIRSRGIRVRGVRPVRNGGHIVVGDDVVLALFDSGHVLGSSQFMVEHDGGSIVYTGDINTVETLLTKPAEARPCETLILESTYGSPEYVFPERERVYGDIVSWISRCIATGEIPAFKSYTIGKAQEIIKMVNTFTSLPVVVGVSVAEACRVFNDAGAGLEYYPVNADEGVELLSGGGCVYVDGSRRRLPTWKRVRWAVATGWALRYRFDDFDRAFPLSGHADFPNLLRYVESVGPRKIFTVHGYSARLASHLRRMGYYAEPARMDG